MVESAELFEAISHPVRIKILKTLEKQPASFASLKRQLDIESSGNLDYHLKKLGQLITVRHDGLYGLTDAGKEALRSIEAIDLWSEMEHRKIRTLRKIPTEAFILMLLELCTSSVAVFWLVSTFSTYFYGSLLSAILAIVGLASVFGILAGRRWSFNTVLAKSALVMFGSLLPLVYWLMLITSSGNTASKITQFYPIGVLYIAFVVAETSTIFIALRSPVKDFLGVKPFSNLPRRAILGGVASMTSAVLTITVGGMNAFTPIQTSTGALDLVTSLGFVSGLAVSVGGILILSRSYVSGALISVIFGLFPYAAYWAPLSLISGIFGSSILIWIPVAVLGSLPIVGGILALVGRREI